MHHDFGILQNCTSGKGWRRGYANPLILADLDGDRTTRIRRVPERKPSRSRKKPFDLRDYFRR